jgi:hypothetical protein
MASVLIINQKGERKMIKAMIIIILSPLAIISVILSIAIIYAMLNEIAKLVIECIKTIVNFFNGRDDKQC